MNLYDNIISVALINMFTLSKKENHIKLYNFNRKDPAHLTLLQVGLMGRQVYGFDLSVELSFFDYLYILWKFKCRKALTRLKGKGNVNCNSFIIDIEEANNQYGIFAKIYEAYYKR